MMICLICLLLIISQNSWADVFSKPNDTSTSEYALATDYKNFYYRGGMDYNAYEAPGNSYQLEAPGILSQGYRYNLHQTLLNLLTRQEFNGGEFMDVTNQQSLSSPLLTLQYSSPALADLYKHLETIANLRLMIRNNQMEDLEKSIDSPIVKLLKQAIYDCVKNGSTGDLDYDLNRCIDKPSLKYSGDIENQLLIQVGANLTEFEQIIPHVLVGADKLTIEGPKVKSRELIFNYRKDFITKISNIIQNYRRGNQLDYRELSLLSVFGVSFTEGQVKNIAMLDDTSSLLAINKIASELAYLKTIDQYSKAVEMLERVMSHPAIEPGYKSLLKTVYDFAQHEIIALKQEKERLSQYADTMHAILDEADRQRLKIIARMQQEADSQEQKGLFKINP